MTSPYLVPIAHLVRQAPTVISVAFEAPFDEAHEFAPRGPAETDVYPEATVVIDLRLESFSGGVRATGFVEAPWHGICRRCSIPVEGSVRVPVDERYLYDRVAGDEETYPLEGDVLDLAPLVHDAILLELPLAPLCRPDCAGLCPICGIDRNEASCTCSPAPDPRWAMLDELRFGEHSDESHEV